jgi:H+-translocating NAD(P) transhydrogenase subunit beta
VKLLSGSVVEVAYLGAAVCFILALKGLSSPRNARRGNLIGAGGAGLAMLTTFLSRDLKNLPVILIAIVLGSAVAVPAARRVQMTQMPQLVALFNGVGGRRWSRCWSWRRPRAPVRTWATGPRWRSPCWSGRSRSPARW